MAALSSTLQWQNFIHLSVGCRSRHSPAENGLRLLDENNIKLIVDSEGAQYAPATLQVQARNSQTEFQQAAFFL